MQKLGLGKEMKELPRVRFNDQLEHTLIETIDRLKTCRSYSLVFC